MTTTQAHPPFFFVRPDQITNGHMYIEGPDARHLAVVRRARPGQHIFAGDGRGAVVEAELAKVTAQRIEADVLDRRAVDRPAPRVVVAQAVSKGTKVDFTIRKLVEIGVDEIVVFSSQRSVPQWDERKKADLVRRWDKVAYEAAKQSRRAWLPQISGPGQLADTAARTTGLALVADADAPTGLRSALNGAAGRDNLEVMIVVGPEGGLSPGEIKHFHSTGATPVRLGREILRTETAGLVLASAVMFFFGRLGD